MPFGVKCLTGRTVIYGIRLKRRTLCKRHRCRTFLQSRLASCTKVNENNDLDRWHGKCIHSLNSPLAKAGAVNGVVLKILGVCKFLT